ncbi:MAG: DUF481 domain-containing protein [Thiovulaceae bacterium]|nr:DUF481 domain-containing protein [Sulfurimonadaceae bacterium]
MKKLLIFLLVLHSSLFAIVSIKPVDIGEKNSGFSVDMMASWSSNQGNSETESFNFGNAIQYDAKQTLTFINASINYGTAKGETNVDKGFIHLRNIYKIVNHLDWETFVQRQRNAFQSLTSRLLLGGGMRINGQLPLIGGKAYLGLGAFHVKEEETSLATKNFARANIYLSYKLKATKNLSLALVSYYQPRFTDLSDYLLLTTTQFDLKINKRFSLLLSINHTMDSLPAQGVSSYDFSQTTALKYKF